MLITPQNFGISLSVCGSQYYYFTRLSLGNKELVFVQHNKPVVSEIFYFLFLFLQKKHPQLSPVSILLTKHQLGLF